MGNPNEHKSVDATVDEFLDNLATPPDTGNEQPPASSPENVEPKETPEAVSGTEKTVSKEQPAGFEGVEKGFANHPAWQKREAKLKEAEAKAEELSRSNQLFSGLLDDPHVYRRYLEAQGFDKATIEQQMRAKGMDLPAKTAAPSGATANAIAEQVCSKLGWDIGRLNDEQKAYVNDQIKLIQAVTEEVLGKHLGDRLKPFENYLEGVEVDRKISKGYEDAKRLAKEEFPDLDWEKDIEPAMGRYLDELDKKDPKRTIAIDPQTLYERATRQLLKEKRVSEARQEERDELKKTARPLKPGPNPPPGASPLKGKTASQTAEAFLSSKGIN